MTATSCTCIGTLERRGNWLEWVVKVLDDECPQLGHRAGVA